MSDNYSELRLEFKDGNLFAKIIYNGEEITYPGGVLVYNKNLDIYDIIEIIEYEYGVSFKWIKGKIPDVQIITKDNIEYVIAKVKDSVLTKGINDAEMNVLMTLPRIENLENCKSYDILELIEKQVLTTTGIEKAIEGKLGYDEDYLAIEYNGEIYYRKTNCPEGVALGDRIALKKFNFYKAIKKED